MLEVGNGWPRVIHKWRCIVLESLMNEQAGCRMLIVAGAILCASSAASGANSVDDWTQWRGPNGSGISAETQWSAGGSELWTKSVGLGYSSVVVSGDRLYTVGYVESRKEDVITCLNAKTGEEIWTHAYPAEKWDKFHGGGTNCTPSLDGERLMVLNREGRFTCLSATKGEVLWKKDMVKEFGATVPTWGFAASPLVLDEMVVVNVGTVVAFDKKSGEIMWTSANLGHAYSTPATATFGDKKCLVVFNGDGVAVLDRETGSSLATHEWKTQYDVNAASPIITGDRIFVSSGYNHGCGVFRFDGESLKKVWDSKIMRTHMSGCVLIGGYLYGFDEALLKCIDLDGKELWSERGLGKGALSAAGNRLLIMSGKGELIIAEATPEAFRVLSKSKVVDGGVCWTTPVIANGLIYCRNSLGTLSCRDHRGQ